MLNFPSTLDVPVSTSTITVPVIQERVTIRRPETRVTDVGKSAATWTWEDLRNYVVRSIEAIHGPFPRNPIKEKAIFSSFLSRWGTQAGPIAKFAFEECEGRWRGAPVSVTRFCKGSDEFFAAPIAERLAS